MKKTVFITRYGKAAYAKLTEQTRAWQKAHPEQVQNAQHNFNRKGGKYYEKNLIAQQTGIQGDKNKIRKKHRRVYLPFKMIIAPDSQLHHEWIPNTADYRGVALVEADAHIHGFVNVIEILDGEITILTEKEVLSCSYLTS